MDLFIGNSNNVKLNGYTKNVTWGAIEVWTKLINSSREHIFHYNDENGLYIIFGSIYNWGGGI